MTLTIDDIKYLRKVLELYRRPAMSLAKFVDELMPNLDGLLDLAEKAIGLPDTHPAPAEVHQHPAPHPAKAESN